MATVDLTHLALGTAALLAIGLAVGTVRARATSPAAMQRIAALAWLAVFFAAPPAAAVVVSGLVTLGLLGLSTAPSVGPPLTETPGAVIVVTRMVQPMERYVELDNGKGVVVFRPVNGVMTSRLRLYRTMPGKAA